MLINLLSPSRYVHARSYDRKGQQYSTADPPDPNGLISKLFVDEVVCHARTRCGPPCAGARPCTYAFDSRMRSLVRTEHDCAGNLALAVRYLAPALRARHTPALALARANVAKRFDHVKGPRPCFLKVCIAFGRLRYPLIASLLGAIPTLIRGSAQWYNGDKFSSEDLGSVYQYNTLIGGVLILQARPDTHATERINNRCILKPSIGMIESR